MTQRIAYFLSVLLALGASLPMHAAAYGVGGCNLKITNYPTIQAAVSAVPPGSTIQICPGVYPEQVIIAQPLTLRGVAFGNASRAVVAILPNVPVSANITNMRGEPVYPQILVQNANSPGPVNIIGITVDGKGAVDLNGNPMCTVGIFYASGTSGTVNEVATKNQIGSTPIGGGGTACGYGIWAENGAGSNQTIAVQNSSVHDFGESGISVWSDQGLSTLAGTIYANFVTGPASWFGGSTGILASGASSSITNNFVTGGLGTQRIGPFDGILVEQGQAGGSAAFTASRNTLADFRSQFHDGSSGMAIADNSTAQSNKVSNAFIGIDSISLFLISTMTSNTIMNTDFGVDFSCTGASTFSKNILNDSAVGFTSVLSQSSIQSNQLDNIDTILDSPCQ